MLSQIIEGGEKFGCEEQFHVLKRFEVNVVYVDSGADSRKMRKSGNERKFEFPLDSLLLCSARNGAFREAAMMKILSCFSFPAVFILSE